MACACKAFFSLLWGATSVQALIAAPCVAPERPFLPQAPVDMRTYAELIRSDFEAYIADAKIYFHCLDAERTPAFTGA